MTGPETQKGQPRWPRVQQPESAPIDVVLFAADPIATIPAAPPAGACGGALPRNVVTAVFVPMPAW